MSLLIYNRCIEDAIQAKVAADSIFPTVQGGTATTSPQYLSLTSSSINMTTGVYTFSSKNQSGTAVNTNTTMTFASCTDSAIQVPQTDLIFYCAMVIVFALGIIAGVIKW